MKEVQMTFESTAIAYNESQQVREWVWEKKYVFTFSRSVSFSWSCLFSVSALDRACLTCFTSSSKPEIRAMNKRWTVNEHRCVWIDMILPKEGIHTYPVDQRWSQSPGCALVSLSPALPAGWCSLSPAWACCSPACSICPAVLLHERPAAAAVWSSLSELYAAV